MACICDECRHLISLVENDEIVTKCDFGAPSEDCCNCEDSTGCALSCGHFEKQEAPGAFVKHCQGCGKELVVSSDMDEDRLYCVACFLGGEK